MGINIRGCGKMDRNMGKDFTLGAMEIVMKGDSGLTKDKETE